MEEDGVEDNRVYLYICIYINVFEHKYICIHGYDSIHTYIYIYICMCNHIHTYVLGLILWKERGWKITVYIYIYAYI
jgi:hypothetical protein